MEKTADEITLTKKKEYDKISITQRRNTDLSALWANHTGACTGFDGGFEAMEAIRGPGPR